MTVEQHPPAIPTAVEHPPVACDGCGQLRPLGDCDECVPCARCHSRTRPDDVRWTARGSRICPDCASDRYWRCHDCDEYNRDGDSCGNGCHDEDCDCADCRGDDDEDDSFGGRVADYGYKPCPVFHGDGPLFLGPEIEISTPPSEGWRCADIASNHLGSLGYLKQDSSIGGGFEIVTHPMSYDWALEHFPWQMLTDLARAGCTTHEGTGLHVHISRDGFDSPTHVYRWMKFLYRNESQVITVARRHSTQWAQFADEDRRAIKDYAKGDSGSRYRAINTTNTDTFELRVFASSLRPQQVQAALGLAAASVEYTRSLRAADILARDGWAWKPFVTWLDEQPRFAPLRRELEALACAC